LPIVTFSAMLSAMTNDATRHDTTDTTGRDTTAEVLVASVAQAAALLGISEGAVRKRLERGQLGGRKVVGQWQVILGESHTTGHDTTTTTDATRHDQAPSRATRLDATRHDDATTPAPVNAAARSQLEAIRDEWLAPLITTIQQQAETIGRVTAERDAALRERAEAEVYRLAAEQARDAAKEARLAGERTRQEEADRAAQLVNLLEDRLRVLHADGEHAPGIPRDDWGRLEKVTGTPSPWWRFWVRRG